MMAAMIVEQAIKEDVREISLEFDASSASECFRIRFQTGRETKEMPPPPVHLFEPLVRSICAQAGVSHWTKGDVFGQFETENPSSKWKLLSSDVTRQICLERLPD
jgi:hypothetical protein